MKIGIVGCGMVGSASAFALLLRQEQTEAAQQRIGVLVGPLTEGARNMELRGWTPETMREVLREIGEA